MNFEILLDDFFLNVASDSTLSPADRKLILSLVNGYQDGTWRYENFENFVWDNVAETSLSYAERNSLVSQSHSMLIAAARNLRLTEKSGDISKGSEVAEIVLYGIMKHHFGALPVVPKIFYKQNSQDNAKGADSVHIVLEGNKDFSLWFGEAKFYSGIEDARLSSIIDSVRATLSTDKLIKENSIITNVSDLASLVSDPVLLKSITEALSHKTSIDELKSKLHVPILLLHQCEITAAQKMSSEKYKSDIIAHHAQRANAYFARQIDLLSENIFLYDQVHFHLILFPVPSKLAIVEAFVEEASHYKRKKA